jgi:hypothetical protein
MIALRAAASFGASTLKVNSASTWMSYFGMAVLLMVVARRYSSMSAAMKATNPMKARVSVMVCSMGQTPQLHQ